MARYYRWRRSTPVYNDEQTDQKNGWYSFPSTVTAVMITSEMPPINNGKFEPTGGTLYNKGDSEITVPRGTYVTQYPSGDETFFHSSAINLKDGSLETANSRIFFSFEHVNVYEVVAGPGTSQGYVYSTSSTAYPNGGVSGGYYYDQRTTVTSPTAPTGLTYPNPITTPTVTVSWTASQSNTSYPVDHYLFMANYNNVAFGDVQTVSGTSIEFQVPLTYQGNPVTSVQFRVASYDTNNQRSSDTIGDWVPVYLAPTLTVPSQLMQGQQATINWTAITGADSYTLQRKANTDADWTQVYSGANLSYSETVGTWTSVQYRVQAVFSGTPGGWAESAAIPVVSSSALVISGTDGDLGTVVNDIPYSISTDTGNQITATITVNSAVIFSGNVGNSTADVIPVLDLVNGEGTIVIEASVQATGGPVSAVRTWTYTKAPITFPNAGSVAQLTKEGENIFPKTLAECVRLPGGKTLDEVTAFPCQAYIGSYAGTGTYGAENPCVVNLPFKPLAFTVSIKDAGSGNTIYGQLIWLNGNETGGSYLNSSNTGICTLQWGETSVSWYSSAANFQLNVSGYEYQYMAIG